MDSPFLDDRELHVTDSGRLPHWQQLDKLVFITFHLADSLPASVVRDLNIELKEWEKTHPHPWSKETKIEYGKRFGNFVNRWLDAGYGECLLRDKANAAIVEKSILCYDNVRYEVKAYVVMSNHVHILALLWGDTSLAQITRGWKSYSAHAINKRMGRSGKLWHRESYDRIIRNNQHFDNCIDYIRKNIRQGGVCWGVF